MKYSGRKHSTYEGGETGGDGENEIPLGAVITQKPAILPHNTNLPLITFTQF